MEVRVATKDVERAKVLVVDLVGLFGRQHVSLQPDGDVRLLLRGEVNGALTHTLKAVERWLERTETASADVTVDQRSYTVEHPGRDLGSARFSTSTGRSSRRARAGVKRGAASCETVQPR